MPDEDRDPAPSGETAGRLGQDAVGAPAQLERLPVLDPPESVAGPTGRDDRKNSDGPPKRGARARSVSTG